VFITRHIGNVTAQVGSLKICDGRNAWLSFKVKSIIANFVIGFSYEAENGFHVHRT
jgi:hypothetical protein